FLTCPHLFALHIFAGYAVGKNYSKEQLVPCRNGGIHAVAIHDVASRTDVAATHMHTWFLRWV
ncbi:hypothetical protein, partial [Novipirellula maiorica]|uniref:hypothetical protein n=1 Tax=Novipirellula maiorica TaxID=1265734 RepID=UPI001F225CE8